MIIFRYQTLMDLGFTRTRNASMGETYAAAEVKVDDPNKIQGAGATEDIPPVLMAPFLYGWKRDVVYQHAGQDRCKIYYIPPDRGKKMRSRKDIDKYFEGVPNEELSSLHFKTFWRPWLR